MPHPFRSVPSPLWNIIFTSCPVPLAVVNDNFEFEEINDAFCALVSRSRSLLLGQTFQSITRSEDIGHDLALADQVRRGDLPGYTLVKAYLKPDFSVVWVQIGVQGYHEGDRRFVCFYVSAVPVTPPVVATGVQPQRTNGFKGWATDNWHKLFPIVLAALGASYALYAQWSATQEDRKEFRRRLDEIQQHMKENK
jgi:PAS domain S-box-containing protein